MTVRKNTDTEKAEADAVGEAIDLTTIPGFHVVRGDGVLLGTYQTNDDAQSFIDGQVAPQDIEASIVEGTAA